jgi:hypothetical protein
MFEKTKKAVELARKLHGGARNAHGRTVQTMTGKPHGAVEVSPEQLMAEKGMDNVDAVHVDKHGKYWVKYS